jgi:hypothetical protein
MNSNLLFLPIRPSSSLLDDHKALRARFEENS